MGKKPMSLKPDIKLTGLGDGFGLTVGSIDEESIEFFNEQGLDGNGHTWGGVVESIIRLEMSDAYDQLSLSPEADDLLVTCDRRVLLEQLSEHVHRYAADESLMARAIENADPDWLD